MSVAKKSVSQINAKWAPKSPNEVLQKICHDLTPQVRNLIIPQPIPPDEGSLLMHCGRD